MPTVVRRRATPLLSFRRHRMAPRVAEIRFAERKDTMVQTCCTARQSSSDGSTPSLVRISMHFFSPSLDLKWQISSFMCVFSQRKVFFFQTACKLEFTITSLHLLFNGRDVFSLNFPSGQELWGDSSLEKQPLFGHLDQDESNQFPHVHPAHHLFKPYQRHKPPSENLFSTLVFYFIWIKPSQLLPGVHGASVNLTVELCAKVFQGAVVSKGAPLRVDAHAAFVSFHQVDVPQLLHVAGVCSRSWKETQSHFCCNL